MNETIIERPARDPAARASARQSFHISGGCASPLSQRRISIPFQSIPPSSPAPFRRPNEASIPTASLIPAIYEMSAYLWLPIRMLSR